MTGALLALALLAPPDGLASPARDVREAAVRALSDDALAARLEGADLQTFRLCLAELRRRRCAEALPLLVRLAAHEDDERGAPAARAAVDIAFAERASLDALFPDGSPRVERAVRVAAEALLTSLGGWASHDRPQLYRPLFAGGDFTTRVLETILRESALSENARSHAVHAYRRHVGAAGLPLLVALLDDPWPRVRATAAEALWRLGGEAALSALAARLEQDRRLLPAVRAQAFSAATWLGRVDPAYAHELAQRVRIQRNTREAVWAGAALKCADPALAATEIERLARRLLRSGAARADDAAILELRLGPLPEAVRAEMRAADSVLARAAAAATREEALAALASALAPEEGWGSREMARVQVCAELLRRHDAPAADRVRFAGSVLESQADFARREALLALRGLDAAAWAHLQPRVRERLDDESEAVRVEAARLLGPDDPDARQVLFLAIYDGDDAAARIACEALDLPYTPDPLARRRTQFRR